MTSQGQDRDGSSVGEGTASPSDVPPREPILRAPWPAVALALSFPLLYAVQGLAGNPGVVEMRFGFSPADLAAGRYGGLVTALFVHGGWPHAVLNALGALAFGAPVARLFGLNLRGVTAFFGLFLVSGVLSSLGYAAVHWGAPYVLIGASGAVSGFMGAVSRLVDRRGALAPFTSRTVISMGLAWVFINVMIGWVGLGGVSGDMPIAWEAHLFGYAAGLILIGPLARLLRRA